MTRPRTSAALLAALALALGGLAGRSAYLGGTLARARADTLAQQHDLTLTLKARRGGVFDRNGELLAGTEATRSAYLDARFLHEQYAVRHGVDAMPTMERDLAPLAALFDLDPTDLLVRLGLRHGARYLPLARHVAPTTLDDAVALGVPGLGVEADQRRHYPQGALAAHVLGGTQPDGRGLEGVERAFEKDLAGTDGRVREARDGRRANNVQIDPEGYAPATHGTHVVVTLDARLQRIIEEELDRVCVDHGAQTGEAVLLDPADGAVLALAGWPAFDPTRPGEAPTEARALRALNAPYEPGSTVKPFIVAAALDARVARLADVFVTGPSRRTGYGRRISDVHGYERLNVWDVLVKSSNVGMTLLGERVGPERLRAALAAVGIGSKTGLDFGAEDAGLLLPLKKWTRHSPDSIVQGYELMVTPLQIARAMCAVANGGLLVTPHVKLGTLDTVGNVVEPARSEFKRAMSQESADAVRRVLADVPVRGTATKARSPVYALFGKTGTSHTAVNGRYDDEHYTASFVGGGPWEQPRLVLALVVRNPDKAKGHRGGVVAAPAAGRMLERCLVALNVPPSPPLPQPPADVAAKLHGFTPGVYARPPERTEVE